MINALPVPTVAPDDCVKLISCVSAIISARDSDAGSDTTAKEREIDTLVYKLYGITGEERTNMESDPRTGNGAHARLAHSN
jgi:hypothetical protein